jgi:hypothetical protein
MRIASFEGWARLNEEAQQEAQAQELMKKAESLAKDKSKNKGILDCIEGKPTLQKAAGYGPMALCSAVVWGLAMYGSAMTGGIGLAAFNIAAGAITGVLTNELKEIMETPEFEKEFNSCRDCLNKVVNG